MRFYCFKIPPFHKIKQITKCHHFVFKFSCFKCQNCNHALSKCHQILSFGLDPSPIFYFFLKRKMFDVVYYYYFFYLVMYKSEKQKNYYFFKKNKKINHYHTVMIITGDSNLYHTVIHLSRHDNINHLDQRSSFNLLTI